MSYLKDFQTHVANHNYPAFLKLWEEYCGGDEVDPEELCAILRSVKGSNIAEFFGRHIERILPLWEKATDPEWSYKMLSLILDVQTTNSETLAYLAYDALQKRYGNDPEFNQRIRWVGLRGKEKFQCAISNYELLAHMKKGNFIFHTGGWGVGEIYDVSPIREQLTAEFDCVPGRKELSFATAFKTLIPLDKNHFLSQRFGNPDLLEKKAKENPAEVIRMLLRDLGPKTPAEIKEELCELVIPEDEWVRWWQTARTKVKKDPMIATPDELREPFRIRHSEVSLEERLRSALDKAEDIPSTIQAIYSFLKDFPEVLKNTESKSILLEKLTHLLSNTELVPSQEMQILFLLQDLREGQDHEAIASLIKKVPSISDLVNAIPIVSLKKRTLVEVRKGLPQWKVLFLELLFTLDQAPLREYILSELVAGKAESELNEKLEVLCLHPDRHPEIFLWYFQKVMGAKDPSLPDTLGKARYFEGLLILLAAIEHETEYRDLVKKIHGIIAQGRYMVVRQVMQSASAEQVKEFLLLATKCHSLSDHDIKIFHSLAEVVYPGIAKHRHKEEAADAGVIWTTEEGFLKLKARIQHIATTETVQNAKDIETARAHGDLRENAEFKAALERRTHLQSELKALSAQMNAARILTKEDIAGDKVGVGSIVECKNSKGQKIVYTLLGPWDADPEKNILSFQSKLAQMMTGKSVGDKFQFQKEEYEIVSLKSFL